jgi:hypothetical protein
MFFVGFTRIGAEKQILKLAPKNNIFLKLAPTNTTFKNWRQKTLTFKIGAKNAIF